jgi:hypothetical protein
VVPVTATRFHNVPCRWRMQSDQVLAGERSRFVPMGTY